MKLGVIGYGSRVKDILKILKELDSGYKLVAITDIRNDEIKSKLVSEGFDVNDISFFDNADDMLAKVELDGVCVGTRCSMHAQMAMKVIPKGIPLFLEKPVATTMEDYKKLSEVYYQNPMAKGKVQVSFPLRVTPLVSIVKEIVASGKIGTIEHGQAVNNVPYGGVYYHSWYRDENETGGLFLQKATHDFDYINAILGIKPVSICAMTSKQIFKGDRPANLMCKDCNEIETCMESPQNLRFNTNDSPMGEYCSFARDTGNEDSGSALIQYETGMHVSYSQNFFARRAAAKRGASFFGYKGTVEFDWYTNEVKVYMHHSPKVETHKIDSSNMSHSGGDAVLAKNFIEMMKGREQPVAPLDAGLLSVLMCLKARESARTSTFQEIR